MTYLSVCSGIEAASAAWEPLGWQAAGFSEIDPFACAVLAHRFPETENYGDMTDFRTWDIAMFDVLVGGTPCQSFSVAGSRKGLTDPRGKLVYTFLEMVEHYRPKYVVWENVPGVLSDKTGVFRLFYTRLQDTGYLCDADILDAADFGVPQRRTRLFVVGINADYILGEHHEAQENRCDGNRSYPRDKFEQARHTYTDTLDSARAFTGGMEGGGINSVQKPVQVYSDVPKKSRKHFPKNWKKHCAPVWKAIPLGVSAAARYCANGNCAIWYRRKQYACRFTKKNNCVSDTKHKLDKSIREAVPRA